MKSIIHVNQHKIKSNRKTGEREDVISVKTYKNNRYGSHVLVSGPSVIVYQPNKPLRCGAVCWIETNSEVTVT